MPEAALRWIFNHSALDGSYGDSVILGASKVEQVFMFLNILGTHIWDMFGDSVILGASKVEQVYTYILGTHMWDIFETDLTTWSYRALLNLNMF